MTCWRSFEKKDPVMGLWLQVTPLASRSDADLAVPRDRPQFISNPKSEVQVESESSNKELVIDGLDNVFAYQKITRGAFGAGYSRYACGNVENFVVLAGCSKRGEDWDWSEIATIVSLQARKIRESFNRDGKPEE
jgi:hypothetical protein